MHRHNSHRRAWQTDNGRFLGMHKAPELVQLAFDDMDVQLQVEHHQSAVLSCSIEPFTSGVILYRFDDAGAVALIELLRLRPHRRLRNRRVCV